MPNSFRLLEPEEAAPLFIRLLGKNPFGNEIHEPFSVVIGRNGRDALAVEGSFEIVLHDFLGTTINKKLLVFRQDINNPENVLLFVFFLSVDCRLSHSEILTRSMHFLFDFTGSTFDDANQQGIVDDLMLFEKLGVFFDNFH